uniref:SLAIN motif-containing protein 2 n=1 Tax=Rhipicephalus appendiculatus TaxID=34631 RepID=A0A131YWF3_RHIAP
MNSVMEDVSSTFALDPQEEMRLLKDKVRQLELQNKQLRRSQQHLRSLSPCKTAEKNSKDLKQSFNMSMSDEGNEKSSKESSLEDLGLIDVEFMSELDDETWLYEPPETGAGDATAALTARERVAAEPREAVAVNSARPSLSDKLDEISQWPSRTFDSRTFTRPRRRRPALDLEAMPTIAAVEAGSPRELPVCPAVQPAVSPGVVSPSKEEASPSSPVPPVVPAQTLPRAPVSVHEIARLQEESLRLSSPISSPKRTPTTSGRVAESSPDDSCLDDRHEVHQSRVQNAEGDPRQRLRTPPLSLARTMENQSPSPGSSPYGSNSSLHQISQIPSKGATRRSLPNLSRVLNGLGTRNPSATGHQSKQQQPSLSHRNNLSQLPQPEIAGRSALPTSARTRSSSVVAAVPAPQSGPSPARTSQTGRRSLGLPQRMSHASPPSRMPPPARYMPAAPPAAPAASTAPTAAAATSVPQRSGLPRPSRIPPPRSQKRSGIPAFSRNAAMPSRFAEPDDDWSDGCY